MILFIRIDASLHLFTIFFNVILQDIVKNNHGIHKLLL